MPTDTLERSENGATTLPGGLTDEDVARLNPRIVIDNAKPPGQNMTRRDEISGELGCGDAYAEPQPVAEQSTADESPTEDAATLDLEELTTVAEDVPLRRVEVIFKGRKVAFFIKTLDPKARNQLDGRKFARNANTGQLEQIPPDRYETHSLGWLLFTCVMNADGTPYYKRIETLLGQAERKTNKGQVLSPRIKGLLEMNDPDVEKLCYDLRDKVYEVNPRLNPMFGLREAGILPGSPTDEPLADG